MISLPPPMPPIGGSDLEWAWHNAIHYREHTTVDQWWLLREQAQDERNKERFEDWQARFKILGPRPGD